MTHCMPLKLHAGIHDAIQNLLGCHNLILEQEHYRLLTAAEDAYFATNWLGDSYVNIPLQRLEVYFRLDIDDIAEGIEVTFPGREALTMGKSKEADAGADIYWLNLGADDLRLFPTFQEMVEAPVFDGQSLKAAWDDAALFFDFASFYDELENAWLAEHPIEG